MLYLNNFKNLSVHFFHLDKLDINLDEKTNQKNQGSRFLAVKAKKTTIFFIDYQLCGASVRDRSGILFIGPKK